MNQNSEFNKELALSALKEANIKYQSFNNDLHWKIGSVDFWPTSLKWIDSKTNSKGNGVFELMEYLRIKYPMRIYEPRTGIMYDLTIEQMFNIAKKVKPMNLQKVCEALHKEIYG